jgi:hypothetical protein
MTITVTKPTTLDELGGLNAPATPLCDVNTMAQAALERALSYTASQLEFSDVEFAVGHIRQGDQTACERFQYALAREVAGYLHAYDRSVRSLHLYDCDATPEDTIFDPQPQNSLVHLIVRTDRKSSALSALIQAFDRALAACYGQRLATSQVSYVLDVQVVEEDEVRGRTGYGALLSSINLRPTLVWEG